MKKDKSYCLIRVSTEQQDFDSQWQGIQNYCKSNNIIIPTENIISEHGVSAFKTNYEDRDAIIQILDLAKQGKIDKLIVYASDRLSRNQMQGQVLVKMLSDLGVQIISVTEGILYNDTDVDDLLLSIRMWGNMQESKKTSKRSKNGKLNISKQGLWNGGRTPYGYYVQDHKLIIDKDKAKIINELYNLYIIEGTKSACEYFFNETGIKKTNQTMNQMLKNPLYKGYFNRIEKYYDEDTLKELTSVYYNELDIVGETTWNKAKDFMNRRRTNTKGAVATALNRSNCVYEGILEHWCGNKLTIDYDYRNKNRQMIFKCKSCKTHKRNDYKKSYSAKKLIPILDKKIDELFIDLDKDKLKKDYDNRCMRRFIALEIHIKELKNKLNDKNKSLEGANKKLKIMFSQDVDISTITIITNSISELKDDVQLLEDEIQNLEVQLKNEKINDKERTSVVEQFVKMKDIYYIVDYKKKRMILQLLLKKIVINDYDEIYIHLKY